MFAVVRHYRFDPQHGAEIDRVVREDFVPQIRRVRGFVRYYWVDAGNGEGVSFSLFRDKAGADESVQLAAEHLQKHLGHLMMQKPEVIEGPVAAHEAQQRA